MNEADKGDVPEPGEGGILKDTILHGLRNAMQAAKVRHHAPIRQLIDLQGELAPGDTLHLDFQAERILGQPLVVLCTKTTAMPVWWDDLSRREQEVTRLLARGLANREIAEELGIAISTVKDHVHQVLKKSKCKRRAAVASAISSGR